MKTRVLEICKKRGISLGELADKMGIKQANLSQSLTRNPTLNTLQAVADNLNVNISDLFEKKETGINGFLEVDGAVRKISGPIDLLPIVGTFGIKSYTNYKVCRNELRAFIKKSLNEGKSAIFSGILEGTMLFSITCHMVGDDPTFILTSFSAERTPLVISFDAEEYWNIDGEIDKDELTQMMWVEIVGCVDPCRDYTDKELEERCVY